MCGFAVAGPIGRIPIRCARGKMKRAEVGLAEDAPQGRAVEFPECEPRPTAVNGALLLDEIADVAVRRHVMLADHARDSCALWIMHTYLIDRFRVSPKLAIKSPTKACGKSTLDVLAPLVHRPLLASNATVAVLLRVVQKHRPTLLIDEVDTFLGENGGVARRPQMPRIVLMAPLLGFLAMIMSRASSASTLRSRSRPRDVGGDDADRSLDHHRSAAAAAAGGHCRLNRSFLMGDNFR
jgi:hypothetical protein